MGLFNPTALIYWILVISLLNKKMLSLTIHIEYSVLVLFLLGVFFGKVIVLYGFGKFSHVLKLRMKNQTTRINRIIGILLVCISIFQFTKLYYF